jgi:hypothetical protein
MLRRRFWTVLDTGEQGMGKPGELKRPVLSDGPLKELNKALHELHLDAGLPSLATMHRELNKRISRSSLYDAFTSTARPPWDTLDALAEILGTRSRRTSAEEEADRFYELWIAAARSVIADEPSATPAAEEAEQEESGLFWIIYSDIVQYGQVTDPEQASMRPRLYHDVTEALDFAGLRNGTQVIDRGDALALLVPTDGRRSSPLFGFLLHLQRLMTDQDVTETPMRLRVAVSRGELRFIPGNGWWGPDLTRGARILDSAPLRALTQPPTTCLAVALTESIHDEVSDHKPRGFRPDFRHLRADTKEGPITFWAYDAATST